MHCYRPSRQYLAAGFAAALLAGFSFWCGTQWPFAYVAAVLFVAGSGVLFFLAGRPAIEVTPSVFRVGGEEIRWSHVERVDSTAWTSPLVLRIGLRGNKRMLLIYPGDVESAARMLRQFRRLARRAEIDGVPYSQYWGEVVPIRAELENLVSPKYRLLRSEDEAEIERLYQQLKTVGDLDSPSSSSDEHSE